MEKIHYAVLFSPRHDIELPLFNYISVCALPAGVVSPSTGNFYFRNRGANLVLDRASLPPRIRRI